jgi:DNA primase
MNGSAATQVLKMLNCRKIRKTGENIMGTCPLEEYRHYGGRDNKPSFGIKLGYRSVFNCFGCGISGKVKDLPKLLAVHNGHYDIMLEQFIKINEPCLDYQPETLDIDTDYINLANIIVSASIPDEVPTLRLNRNDIEKWDIRYNPLENVIMFPVYDKNKKLLAIKCRTVLGKNFFYHRGSANTKKLGIWYGMDKVNKLRKIVLCEGERDAIFLSRYGITAWACQGFPSDDQIKTIKKLIKPIVLFFDNDKAGKEIKEKIIDECKLFNDIYAVTDYSDLKDPAEIVEFGKLNEALSSIQKIC